MIIEFKDWVTENYSRRLFNGIQAYCNLHNDASVLITGAGIVGRTGVSAEVDGVISQIPQVLRNALQGGVPCVNVSSNPFEGVPQVCNDNDAICTMIVRHFRDRNFRTLAMLIDTGDRVSGPRKTSFIAACDAMGFVPHLLQDLKIGLGSRAGTFGISLAALPKPLGLVLCKDSLGPFVYELCQQLGMGIPNDIALVGINNSFEYADAEPPRLSSVDNNAERIGYEAAAKLARLIRGEKVPPVTHIPPRELIARSSSDITIYQNPNIAKALEFIRTHFQEEIELEDIVRQQELGRRALELHFKSRFNESPMQYLRSQRLEKAKSLLETTQLSVTEISRVCGIRDNNYFSRIFRETYDRTPLNYRRQFIKNTL